MWESQGERLDARAHRYRLFQNTESLRYADVAALWQRDEGFRSFFNSLLAASPFQAFRWETPPVTRATAARAFEFVLLDCPALAVTPDPEAFADQFRSAPGQPVVAFSNLSGDAFLVVPSPLGPASAYGHLASFVRAASAAQQHALWQTVGRVFEQRLGERPVWLSTAGLGVPWLHVRFDSRPKYYGHRPYACWDEGRLVR